MKKYISIIILASLVLSFSIALAEENKEGFKGEMKTDRTEWRQKMENERKEFHDKLKTERDSFMSELKAKREEFRKAGVDKRRDFWNKAKEMVSQRFGTAVKNLENVQTRVGSVIEKLSLEGKDTEDADAALNSSKSNLVAAKAKIAEIKTLLPATTGDAITPEVFEKIKLLAREAKDLMKESKEDLRESIQAIKDLREDNSEDDNYGE